MATRVVSVRRYPVKSMGGESLQSVRLDERGLAGDRWYAVRDADDRLASGKNTRRFRRYDPVFTYAAETTDDGVVVSGHGGRWLIGDPGLDRHLAESFAEPVSVQPESEIPHFDDGPVSIVGTATLAWCTKHFGLQANSRRLRVNLVIETDEPFVEETWQGQTVMIGSTRLRFTGRVPRCRMIDIDQDGIQADGGWLKALATTRDGNVAMYANVATPGVLEVGQALRLDWSRLPGRDATSGSTDEKSH